MIPPADNPHALPTDQPDWAEQISAYLDDELAPEERAQVEQRLAEDPAARRLLEELTALTATLHELPAESAPRDLADAVLRTAEQRMLTAGPQHGAPRSGGLSLGRSKRGWAWAAMAIAAAVVLMVFQRSEPGASLAKSDAGAASRAEPRVEEQEPASVYAADELEEGREGTNIPAAPEPSDAMALRLDSSSRSAAPAPETAAPMASGAAAPRASGAAGPRDNEELFADPPAPARSTRRIFGADAAREMGERVEFAPPAAEGAVLVRLGLHPEAFRNRFVDGVLGSNGIEVRREPLLLTSEDDQNERRSRLGGAGRATSDRLQSTDDSPARGGRGERDIVLVNAPQSQIAAALSDFNNDFVNCRQIEVQPAFVKPEIHAYNRLQEEVLRHEQAANELGVYSRSGVGPAQVAKAPMSQQQVGQRKLAANTDKPGLKGEQAPTRGVAVRLETTDPSPTENGELLRQLTRVTIDRNRGVDFAGGEAAEFDFLPVVLFVQPANTPDAPPTPAAAPSE